VSDRVQVSQPSWPVRDGWPRGRILDFVLTSLSGVPATGERPHEVGPLFYLLTSIVAMAAGVLLAAGAATHGGIAWFLLFPAYVLDLHGLRKIALTVYHECSHRAFIWGKEWANDLLGDVLGVLPITQHYRGFKAEHVDAHHPRLMTKDDPTVRFNLDVLGLRPGMSERALRTRLIARLVSPEFNLRILALRLRDYLAGSNATHRVLALLYASLVGLAIWAWGFRIVFWAWLLPLTIPFNIVYILKDCCEHVYPTAGVRGVERMAKCTHQVRYGRGRPETLGGWPLFLALTVLYDIPTSLVFGAGENRVHDFHHRHASTPKWTAGVYERQREVCRWHELRARGEAKRPPYTHVEGLHRAIAENLRTLSQADPSEIV
jgi:fatty acid desaturase